jgi:DMSO/TMAO reductase YedYZ molybdopterin-dependent catalytic subunit
MVRPRHIGLALAGLLAGLIAAVLLTQVQLAMRSWLGISPPQEMIPDRLAPAIGIERFLQTLRDLGGYDEAKRFGIRAGLLGVLAVGTIVGGLYAWATEWGRSRPGDWPGPGTRQGIAFIAVAGVVLWIGSMVFLAPTLDTNFRGLPPRQAEAATAIGYFVAYAIYAIAVVSIYAFLTRPALSVERAAAPKEDHLVARRALVTIPLGVVFGLPIVALLQRMRDYTTFDYDGRIYTGDNLNPITPNEAFYTVTKNVIDPEIDHDVWGLQIGGLVDNPRTYDFKELTDRVATQQETTLMCISNRVSAGLISNAIWTGVPMATLLTEAGADGSAVEVVLRGADGYTDTFPIEKAMEPTTLIAWRMNGENLPRIHGNPVRAIVPGLYGEKSVKWLTGIEVVDHDVEGFYEEQGWGPDFTVPTRSDFFSPRVVRGGGGFVFRDELSAGERVKLRGRAFAGDRGISKIEVSTDGGESWDEAEKFYQSTPLAWVFWEHVWIPETPGKPLLVVRAYDGSGELQETRRRDSFPREGDTGLHRVTAIVVA